jgi:drug/metabolite transporter (DMT)-like permease
VTARGTMAIALYTLATRQQRLALAVVLIALDPVIPVVLGLTVLRERVTRLQQLAWASPAHPSP